MIFLYLGCLRQKMTLNKETSDRTFEKESKNLKCINKKNFKTARLTQTFVDISTIQTILPIKGNGVCELQNYFCKIFFF